MTHLLIYAPTLPGHPQSYCRVITAIMDAAGWDTTILAGFGPHNGAAQWPDLLPLLSLQSVRFRDAREFTAADRADLSAEELITAQRAIGADVTLFIEADRFRAEFVRIASGGASALRGHNVGIFARTSMWWPGEDFYSGLTSQCHKQSIRAQLGLVKRALFARHATDRYFFEQQLLRRRVLQALLVKDERVADQFGPPVFWLPEIFQPFDRFESPEDALEVEVVGNALGDFRQRQAAREPILYFGQAAFYRGYDLYLGLLAADNDAYGIHAGASYTAETAGDYPVDVANLRTRLKQEGRLFETGAYVRSWRLVDRFFATVTRTVSTHRLTASSGTTLQSLAAGRPVLAPHSGLLGHRIRSNALGETYRYGDRQDLLRRWLGFKRAPIARYADAIADYMQRYSVENLSKCVRRALTP